MTSCNFLPIASSSRSNSKHAQEGYVALCRRALGIDAVERICRQIEHQAEFGLSLPQGILAGAQRLLCLHPIRRFNRGDKYAADAGGRRRIRYRAVAYGEACVFPFSAVPLDTQKQVFGKKGAALAGKNRLMQRPELRLDFGPHLVKRQAESPRMLLAKNRLIAVVVDHREIGPPPHRHRKARCEHDVDKQSKTGRPAVGRAKRGLGPVLRTNKCGHL